MRDAAGAQLKQLSLLSLAPTTAPPISCDEIDFLSQATPKTPPPKDLKPNQDSKRKTNTNLAAVAVAAAAAAKKTHDRIMASLKKRMLTPTEPNETKLNHPPPPPPPPNPRPFRSSLELFWNISAARKISLDQGTTASAALTTTSASSATTSQNLPRNIVTSSPRDTGRGRAAFATTRTPTSLRKY